MLAAIAGGLGAVGAEVIFTRKLALLFGVTAPAAGTVVAVTMAGMALGSAGVEALANLRGRRDLFERELQVSEHAIADSVASAAELLMGEADEATPVVIVRGLEAGESGQDAKILFRPEHEDMFR